MAEGMMTRLDELLSDPMVQLVMARDSVRPEDLREMIERDSRRVAKQRLVLPAHVIAACQSRSLCY